MDRSWRYFVGAYSKPDHTEITAVSYSCRRSLTEPVIGAWKVVDHGTTWCVIHTDVLVEPMPDDNRALLTMSMLYR